ncbi:hypothetical protein [Pedobacter sp. L105]|uniref:hypothetical protein n=1 Tax=Pedobacter sp. L105 TaxID=1641871 RepID=UPI00131E4A49|nr:hypothetical protein [Pedobacter sp. L105]
MKRIVHGLWFFYQKLIVPSLALAIFISFFTMKIVELHAGIGISFIFLAPVFHYATYEVKHPNEYYFYYNLGLSKAVLWVNTIITSIVIGFILIII